MDLILVVIQKVKLTLKYHLKDLLILEHIPEPFLVYFLKDGHKFSPVNIRVVILAPMLVIILVNGLLYILANLLSFIPTNIPVQQYLQLSKPKTIVFGKESDKYY